jgi:hypothetical protein
MMRSGSSPEGQTRKTRRPHEHYVGLTDEYWFGRVSTISTLPHKQTSLPCGGMSQIGK